MCVIVFRVGELGGGGVCSLPGCGTLEGCVTMKIVAYPIIGESVSL